MESEQFKVAKELLNRKLKVEPSPDEKKRENEFCFNFLDLHAGNVNRK